MRAPAVGLADPGCGKTGACDPAPGPSHLAAEANAPDAQPTSDGACHQFRRRAARRRRLPVCQASSWRRTSPAWAPSGARSPPRPWPWPSRLYLLRMFGVCAGYHRYFSHRAFKTSRVGQFVLACLAQSSAQRGVLWWAAKHRWHHLHSDTEQDVHSPARHGFVYAHLGWIFSAAPRRDRPRAGRRPRQIPRAGLARPPPLPDRDPAGRRLLAARRLARPVRRLLLEHGRGLARHVLHQLAGPRARQPALRHRRRFPQQLVARHRHPGRGLAQQPPRLPVLRPPGLPLVAVRPDLLHASRPCPGWAWSGT